MLSPIDLAERQLTLMTHRVRTLPIVVLMPHSRCNCRCVMCDIWRANRDRRELRRQDLEAHVDSFTRLSVKWFVLSGGEALMHSNLWSLCELLKATTGARLSLLSTGLLLRRHAGEVVRWCDEVILSLDGSQQVHDAIRRVPRAFEQLADGIAALRELRSTYRVTGRCVIQRGNFRDLPKIIDAARAIGLDRLSFLAADVSSEAFNRPGGWDAERTDEVALSAAEADELSALIEGTIVDHAAAFGSGFVAESPDKLRALGRYFQALHDRTRFPETVCNAPWVSTVIEANGQVLPCYFHPPFGNLKEAPLVDLLNSPKAITFRRDLDVKNDPICQKCVCTLHLKPWQGV